MDDSSRGELVDASESPLHLAPAMHAGILKASSSFFDRTGSDSLEKRFKSKKKVRFQRTDEAHKQQFLSELKGMSGDVKSKRESEE